MKLKLFEANLIAYFASRGPEKSLKIRRIHLQKKDLLRMGEKERAFIMLAGHMQNELNSLHKVFSWCLNDPSPGHTSKVESVARGAQAMIYARILAGKLYEAHVALKKAFFGTEISHRVEPKLHHIAQDALKKIKSYFSKSNSIFKVRNLFAFHYSIEEFNNHWNEAADEQTFELILGGTVGNTLNLASELVVNTALLNGIKRDDNEEALRIFFDDVQSIAANFTDFLEGAILAIFDDQLGSSYLAEQGRDEELSLTESYNEVVIPYFFKPI